MNSNLMQECKEGVEHMTHQSIDGANISSPAAGSNVDDKRRLRALAIGATALGALAVGALAVGALAIGRLAVGGLAICKSRVGKLEIDELDVTRLRVHDLQIVNGPAVG